MTEPRRRKDVRPVHPLCRAHAGSESPEQSTWIRCDILQEMPADLSGGRAESQKFSESASLSLRPKLGLRPKKRHSWPKSQLCPRQQQQQQSVWTLAHCFSLFDDQNEVKSQIFFFFDAMPQLPTPPLSREASVEPTSGATTRTDQKLAELDALLERYLHLLDRHQRLHAELGKQLSFVSRLQRWHSSFVEILILTKQGFLALSHANYCAPPGRRYGKDYYDERMKATRRM